jgi:hypothetical protein
MAIYSEVVCLLVCLIAPCGWSLANQQQVEEGESAIVKKAPSIDGDTYKCGEMVQVVNHLRKLGKERSIAALREYLLTKPTNKKVFDNGANEKVLFICRLLFVNPKGWHPPGLGGPHPNINAQVAKQFPLFPIAISNGVPFLLIRGYELRSRPKITSKV